MIEPFFLTWWLIQLDDFAKVLETSLEALRISYWVHVSQNKLYDWNELLYKRLLSTKRPKL